LPSLVVAVTLVDSDVVAALAEQLEPTHSVVSVSQAFPTPSPSASAWFAFATSGQLSAGVPIPSPSGSAKSACTRRSRYCWSPRSRARTASTFSPAWIAPPGMAKLGGASSAQLSCTELPSSSPFRYTEASLSISSSTLPAPAPGGAVNVRRTSSSAVSQGVFTGGRDAPQ
jgi:hypothetical protein